MSLPLGKRCVPHLHCHIIPRYHSDAAPNGPPGPIFEMPSVELAPQEYEQVIARLREGLNWRIVV